MPSRKSQTGNIFQNVAGFIAVIGAVWFFYGGGLEKQAAADMKKIEAQVADDAVQQYGIAKRGGSAIDACVHAGMVAAAYLQAKDEANYQRWKLTESSDCERAGVPK